MTLKHVFIASLMTLMSVSVQAQQKSNFMRAAQTCIRDQQAAMGPKGFLTVFEKQAQAEGEPLRTEIMNFVSAIKTLTEGKCQALGARGVWDVEQDQKAYYAHCQQAGDKIKIAEQRIESFKILPAELTQHVKSLLRTAQSNLKMACQ